jgi:uncharacterized membrane protein YphA (DoxX/SURF4 family)
MGILLIFATWPLWWSNDSSFPRVPFIADFGSLGLEAGLTIGMLLSLAVVFFASCVKPLELTTRLSAAAFVLCGVSLVVCNQHRLQPWMYHFLVVGALFLSIRGSSPSHTNTNAAGTKNALEQATRHSLSWRKLWSSDAGLFLLLTSSIYIWSGWSKLDYSFAHSYGQLFARVLLEPFGIATHLWSNTAKQITALALPLAEILAGVLLLVSRTRNLGFVLSILMHVALLIIVGPLGLQHENGVVIWNGFFLVQNVLLWKCLQTQSRNPISSWFSRVVVALVVVLPAFRTIGFCDNWPAWAVYASSTSRVYVLVDPTSVADEFPTQHCEPRQVQGAYNYLRIDRWSIAKCHAPTYPQDRFQIAICLWLYKTNANLEMQIVWESSPDRWTGKRTTRTFRSEKELQEFAQQQYWVGTRVKD